MSPWCTRASTTIRGSPTSSSRNLAFAHPTCTSGGLGQSCGSDRQNHDQVREYLCAAAEARRPIKRVVVVGDVNSTLACSLVAAKLNIPVAHVEAGLRSNDRTMPEEINRLVTDSLADLLLCSEPAGVENLLREGHPVDHVLLVGNTMIDTLLRFKPKAQERDTLEQLGLLPGGYGIVTLHRPANVDEPAMLGNHVEQRSGADSAIGVRGSSAPATRLKQSNSTRTGDDPSLEPQDYLDFCLTSQAKFIVTDSGGLQEEATALSVPC